MFDRPISYAVTRSISEVVNVKNELWLPTFSNGYRFTFLRMRGRDVTCFSAFVPVCSSCNQTIQQNCVEVLLGSQMINYILPSLRYFDYVCKDLKVHSRLEQ